jgi:hypothetical protein
MSEFSESYHLRSERIEDAVELLRRADRKGYAYPPVNGWVTFVAEEGVFEPDRRIVAAACQPLLHYVSAEDHGWSFTLFDRTEVISGYRCDWDDEISYDDSRYSGEALRHLVPSAQLDDFEQRLHPADFDALFEIEPAKILAQALGLEHYDWLAYDYVAGSFPVSPGDFPGVIEVK